MNYCVNIDIDGFSRKEITDPALYETEGDEDNIIVFLDASTNGKLNSTYNAVRNMIITLNRPIIVMLGSESKIRKQVCMLMASYRHNDMYEVSDRETVTKEYALELIEREPTQEETEMFVGADITGYAEIGTLLSGMSDKMDADDKDGLIALAYEYRGVFNEYMSVIDYMKRIVDNSTTGIERKIREVKEQLNASLEQLEDCKNKLRVSMEESDNYRNEAEGLRKEMENARKRCAELENQINASGPVIRTYTTLNTATIRCKPSALLYFKEISYVNYINSFIHFYFEYLVGLMKLKVKLLIYDNSGPYTACYKPLNVVGSTEFLNNKDAIVNKYPKLVIVETNQAILEDILNADYDVVIIYDRLKQRDNIIMGNSVAQFYVINSMKDISSVKEVLGEIDKSRIITREGVMAEAIGIGEIDGYKENLTSDKARMAAHVKYMNKGNNKMQLFKIIDSISHIDALQKKKK